MKKLIIFVLLMSVALSAFADDALVLPKGVFRTYVTGAFGFATSEWDENGDKQDLLLVTDDGSFRLLNVGAAIEFGVTDWISAAVQWAPGWNVWSSFYNATTVPFDKATLNGPSDIFAGAKIQVIGENAPVASEIVRLAAAPGVKIPLPSPDWQKQDNNIANNKSWILAAADKHALGVGARAYFDYVLNEMIYINLYGEFIYFPVTVKIDTQDYFSWAFVQATLIPNYDVDYGYDLTLEAEPHFEIMLMDGIRLGVGVPLTFTMSPEVKYNDTAQADTDSHLLAVGPNVSIFLMNSPVPIEFKAGFTLPLLGKNSYATNVVLLQVKTYLKFW